MKLVPNTVSRAVAGQVLLGRRNAPTILFGAGIAGSIASTVLACRATLKLEDVVKEAKSDLDIAKSITSSEYGDAERRHDIALIYARSIGKLTRMYAPSVLLGGASIGCLTKSHNILQERNLALTAAYAAVDRAFNEYRARVVDKYGEEQDRLFRYDAETVEVPAGKNKVKEELRASPANENSMYARFFDQQSGSWSKEPEYNLLFLRAQQNYANDILKARGHLFLNEVYDMLGIDRTEAGAVVGWLLDGDGDGFVDFGFYDHTKEMVRNFVNGREGSILLDFNVDGIIFDKITEHRERLAWQK